MKIITTALLVAAFLASAAAVRRQRAITVGVQGRDDVRAEPVDRQPARQACH